MDPVKVLCYNKGCGVEFDPNSNNEGDCCYHPGAPVFHDAYKKWSCCNKRSIDFTTFLGMKGCVRGKHNPEKPIPLPKPVVAEQEEVIQYNSPELLNTPRIRIDTALVTLEVNVNQKLKDVLEATNNDIAVDQMDVTSEEIKHGESCKNSGCKSVYEGEQSNMSECIYHPGFPIFHEGLKYWTCCQKKTSNFDSFLDQKGCSKGSHLWKKQNVTQTSCRHDWHQTGQHVFITVYAKHCQPDRSSVKANQIKIYANILFADNSTFVLDRELIGTIKPEESVVTMFPSKIEIKLVKAGIHNWRELFVAKVKQEVKTEAKTNSIDHKVDINDVDLSDI